MNPPFSDNPIQQQNQTAYDRMARSGHILATVVSKQELNRPLEVVDGLGWLGGSIKGWNVLCLAAGGGRHSALYHAAGANVTVLDISDGMLELDRQMAAELKINVRIVQGSMVDMPMLLNEEFDLVVQPVSTCYVREIDRVFSEVHRVLKPNGLYISQHKQPINLQASLSAVQGKYIVETEVNDWARPLQAGQISSLREPNTKEFAHCLESILGGICKVGMVIEALMEPNHANLDASIDTLGHRSRFIPPYIRVKARKPSLANREKGTLILPKGLFP